FCALALWENTPGCAGAARQPLLHPSQPTKTASCLARFLVCGMFTAMVAILVQLKPLIVIFLVFLGGVVTTFDITFGAVQMHNLPRAFSRHDDLSFTSQGVGTTAPPPRSVSIQVVT